MKSVERLGRRKEEARAGLEAARGKHPAPFPLDPQTQALATKAIESVLGAGEHALEAPAQDEFALRLGAYIAGLRHKVTLLPSPRLAALGDFVDALLERVVVVNHEPRGKKSEYASDRLFVSIALATEAHDMTYLAESGHPVLQWTIEPDEIGAEIARWRIANALVEELVEKPQTEAVTMPAEPSLRTRGLALFAPHADILRKAAGTLGAAAAVSPAGWIAAHVALAEPEEFVEFACWLPKEAVHEISSVQGALRNATKLAVTSSFGFARPHPQAYVIQLTSSEQHGPVAGARVLRVHSEDGDVAKIVESLREATKMLSRK